MTDPERVTVKIRRLPAASGLSLPSYQTSDAAAVDLRAAVAEPVEIPAGGIEFVPTGVAVAIPPGYEGQIRPRSGLGAKHGISMPNTPATIDADYRGELRVILINHGRDPFRVERGMRIAQMLVQRVPRIVWEEVEELPESSRGAGGFGHTGQD